MVPVPFAVDCSCGATARGERRARHQLAPCPGCGQPLFVFPLAPALAALRDGPVPAPPKFRWPWPPARVAFWLGPAAAVILALGIVGVVIAAIVRQRPGDGRPMTESRAADELAAALARFPGHCAKGSYTLAVRDLDEAHALWTRFPRAVTAEKARQLRGWRRQAALVADLSAESLGEIVRHAAGLEPREWRQVFDARYRDRGVILDAKVTREADGRYGVDYHLDDDGRAGAWDFKDLALLPALNLQTTTRLVFGVRLAAVEHVGEGWVVRPRPDSGVLFTEPAVFAQLSVAIDDDLRAQLRLQALADPDGPP